MTKRAIFLFCRFTKACSMQAGRTIEKVRHNHAKTTVSYSCSASVTVYKRRDKFKLQLYIPADKNNKRKKTELEALGCRRRERSILVCMQKRQCCYGFASISSCFLFKHILDCNWTAIYFAIEPQGVRITSIAH